MRATDSWVMEITLKDQEGNVRHTFVQPHHVCPECLGFVSAPFPGGWRSHLDQTISPWTGKPCTHGRGQKNGVPVAAGTTTE